MKTSLKKMLGLTALGMTLLSTTVPTWAGSVSTPEVSIERAATYLNVSGSIAGARYSADSAQYIGCAINAAPHIYCYARDSAGNVASCFSNDPQHIAAGRRITDSSLIRFELNPSDSACSNIRIYNSSGYLK